MIAMPVLREDEIHYACREYLRSSGWTLLAGQYPDGTDDELFALNVLDPTFARDDSPDPRRHSKNKLSPDIVAIKGSLVLLIELKPTYDKRDEAKLLHLLGPRRNDLISALEAIFKIRKIALPNSAQELVLLPTLGFSYASDYPPNKAFCYLRVRSLSDVIISDHDCLRKP